MLKARHLMLLPRRWKGGKTRWSIQQRKKTNTDRALDSFDDFYGSVFGVRWNNMRAALLSDRKYIAMVNNFGDTEKTCSTLEMDGAINIKSLIQLSKERLEKEEPLFTKTTSYKLSERLEDLIKKQEEREKMSLYPESKPDEKAVHVPETLSYTLAHDKNLPPRVAGQSMYVCIPETLKYGGNEEAPSRNQNAIQSVDVKKSLSQAIEEDTHLDKQRLVDPQFGTGGLYDYVPANTIKGMEDWIPESDHYKYYQTSTDFPLKIEMETEFTFPENLCLYTYEMGNCSDFKSPKKCLTGVLSHFLMDGASILPPLFLDVKHGERVLDACAAPGGKSLLMLQTLHPDQLVCNDVQESRLNRLRKVMQEYLFDYHERWDGKRLVLNQADARNLDEYGSYDKILVDVPCTTDRHALMENDNNIFKPSRIKERLRIPELQAGILTNCLRLLKPGGSLVYSTCSLSPVQNDGVVHMALQKVFSEHGITATIKDLSVHIQLFSEIYRFENPKGLKYGQMVVPYLPANFGPMYFSKITRDAEA